MKKRIIAVALTTMLVCGELLAWTPRRREPTAGADLIAYQMIVGSTMKRDGDAVELFGTDSAGDAFEKAAIETIKKRLREHGIASEADSLETKARAHFSAAFYGHRIEAAECDDVYVFYLMARGSEQTAEESFEDTWEWSSLNSARGTDLDRSLMSELQLALDDYLADRPATPSKPPSN